jgi:hypothetical protein
MATWIVRSGGGVELIVGIPAAALAAIAVLISWFLRPSPTQEESADVHRGDIDQYYDREDVPIGATGEVHIQPLLDDRERRNSMQISGLVSRFVAALKVSGVVEYSVSYGEYFYSFYDLRYLIVHSDSACLKCVNCTQLNTSYKAFHSNVHASTDTLFFWLPLWLKNGSLHLSKDRSDFISTFYDAGGVIGGLVVGWLSDRLGRRCPVVMGSLLLSAASLMLLRIPGVGIGYVAFQLALSGALINGPATLITTAISADLGLHPSTRGRPAVMSTVAGIIDGTGSVGAAIGQLVVGRLSESFGVDSLFYFLIPLCVLSALCLVRRMTKERSSFVS